VSGIYLSGISTPPKDPPPIPYTTTPAPPTVAPLACSVPAPATTFLDSAKVVQFGLSSPPAGGGGGGVGGGVGGAVGGGVGGGDSYMTYNSTGLQAIFSNAYVSL